MTAFCEGCETKRSSFGANTIIRAFGTSSAYSSTVKPAGTLGSAASGRATTDPKFGLASLGAGKGGKFCCAKITAETLAPPRKRKARILDLVISYSNREFYYRTIVTSYGVTLKRPLAFAIGDCPRLQCCWFPLSI
jgi:hypothetical protein